MLVNNDARALLAFLPTESVDLIVSDVPYKTISGGNGAVGRPTGVLLANDGKMFRHNNIKPDEYLPDFFRVMKSPGHVYIFTNLLNLWSMHDALLRAGFKIHNLLTWKKQNATPNRYYMKNAEFVIMARKGPAMSINDCGSMMCHAFTNPIGDKHHPTEKPVDLLRFYIENSSQPGDTVLDPFMGSGSTGIAAVECGRKFIGSEIDPEHYATACRRMGVMP